MTVNTAKTKFAADLGSSTGSDAATDHASCVRRAKPLGAPQGDPGIEELAQSVLHSPAGQRSPAPNPKRVAALQKAGHPVPLEDQDPTTDPEEEEEEEVRAV
ncbi:hypothetical protein V502_02039 [Pseudogymnoascus sp. VKM F-4520 (FW-2644)]|nr:hypothetical protein V502_02039 [Pseudogymnoascus sp. VKM F-4520 (FW-2644)]